MGALPRPAVPDGPLGTLFTRLHELHHQAGWPSLRDMAKEIGCSHTTISAAFSRPVAPRWGLLELIVEELGGDTGEFHRLWLDATRGADVPAPPAASARRDVPRQLPSEVPAFTGRSVELARLDALLSSGTGAVISGTAGVGKTALAVHWAHRVADRFPDGQLYLDLRGYDPRSPVATAAALESLLRSLGVDGAAVPQDQADRAARYRSELAGSRMLVLLDNANSVEQIRDLLPGAAGCFVLVTSRDSLRGLVARHGSVRVDLDLLPALEAVLLLRTLLGRRVDDEPEEALRVVHRCARLPLALRIAAELAATRPQLRLADLNVELEDESGLLDALATGDDEYSAVRTVFSWSRAHLSGPAAELFALIGLHPGPDLGRQAAIELSGAPPAQAVRALDELTRAHVIARLDGERYVQHDLLREYAMELAGELDETHRAAARARVRDYYLGTAAGAVACAYPHRAAAAPVTSFDDADAARAWLRAEWRNLVALAEDEPAAAAVEVSGLLADYLDERSSYDAGYALHELARRTARRAGDRAGEGRALHDLGLIERNQGRFDAALARHSEALAALRDAGDRRGEGRALQGIGTVRWRQGDYQGAYDALRGAVAIQHELGERADEGNALYGLGIASRRLGRYAEAEAHHLAAIDLLRAANDVAGEGRALNNLGVVHLYLGRHDDALSDFEQALAIHQRLDSRLGEGVVHDNLGSVRRRLGDCDAALAEYRAALAIYLDIGYRIGEADALRGIGATFGLLGRTDAAIRELRRAVELGRALGEVEVTTGALTDLGEVHLAAGDAAAAVHSFQLALDLGGQAGDPYYTARALDGSACALLVTGDDDGARARWQRAWELYTEMGLPEAQAVRDRLDRH